MACQTQIGPSSRGWRAAALAGLTAALGWAALLVEGTRSLAASLAEGRSFAEAAFLFLRFFTILTNIWIAALMSVAAARLVRGRSLPGAAWFNAALAYILVTCVTYEALLRQLWSPHGLQLVTDTILHDVVPALTLLFWIAVAPRTGTRWRDALWSLVYPAVYFALTLAAGALGAGYPYGFLDVDKVGFAAVAIAAAIFLAIFYALGLATTAVAKAAPR